MKKITIDNLKDLAIGSAILGSGGGGAPDLMCLQTKVQMEKTGPVSLIGFNELKPNDVILPIGFMGAPSAETEMLMSGQEFDILLGYVEKILNTKVTVLMPFEIGGGNAFVPFYVGSKLGLPVLDADTMGRAFPEAQMTSYNLMEINQSHGFITDCLGNTTVIYAENVVTLEKLGRQIVVAMGSAAGFGFFPSTVEQAEKYTFHKSISKSLSIGRAFHKAKNSRKDPVEAILNFCKGVKIASGKIVDIDRAIDKGFLYGAVTIQNHTETIEVGFQNEFLVVKLNGTIMVTTPDIIMLLEQETGEPIDSQQLQYGLKVHVIALPAPSLWTTPAGLALVGPRHFGYEIDYCPVNHLRACSKSSNRDL